MQTAVGVFGGEDFTDGMDSLPLMVENAGSSGRSAISSLNCPPIVSVELCREHLVCPVKQHDCLCLFLECMRAPFYLVALYPIVRNYPNVA